LYRIRQDDFPAGFFYVKFWEIGESIDRNQWGCEISDGVFDFIAHGVIFLKKCVKLYGNKIPFDKLGIKCYDTNNREMVIKYQKGGN
jgi:hypothetical protein